MTVITLKHVVRMAPVLAALVIAMGSAQPASAEQCAQELLGCSQQAATLDGFWQRAAAGLDCEFGYASCVYWTY